MDKIFKIAYLSSISILLYTFVPERADAQFALTGLADLEYMTFQENASDRKVDASQFQQTYEVGTGIGGDIIARQIGNYSLNLRYQHKESKYSISDTFSGDESGHLAKDKLLWSGAINIVPRNTPIDMRIYFGDITPMKVTYVSPFVRSTLTPQIINSLEADTYTTLGTNSGIHLEIGSSGKRVGNGNGGNSNGRGNGNGGNGGNGNGGNGNGNGGGLLNTRLPRIVLDYRNTYIDSDTIQESYNDFKFSLNEGRNWLSYSWKKYDNLNGIGDYTEEGYRIGNAAPEGGREWFYLTNWVTLSIDGQFLRKDIDDAPGRRDYYEVNIFANAFRSWWNAYLYGSYSQATDTEQYRGSEQFYLPLYVYARPYSNTMINWKSSFKQIKTWDMDNPTTVTNEELTRELRYEVIEDVSSTHLHLTKQDLILKPRYNMIKEWGLGSSHNTAHLLGFSIESDPKKSYGYGGSYTLNSRIDDNENTETFRSHSFSISGRYPVRQWIGISGSQTVILINDKTSSTESRTYNTSIGVNIYMHRTMSMDFRGTRNYSESNGADHSDTKTLSGNLRYTPAYWIKLVSSNAYSKEDSYSTIIGPTDNRTISTSNNIDIRVNRSFSSRTNISYSEGDDYISGRTTNTVMFDESFEYTVLGSGYRIRTLFNIIGGARHSETTDTIANDTCSNGIYFTFNHYPYTHFAWGASGSYSMDNPGDTRLQKDSIYIAFPFQKLNLNASYFYEKRESDTAVNDYDAHKLLVKLTKNF